MNNKKIIGQIFNREITKKYHTEERPNWIWVVFLALIGAVVFIGMLNLIAFALI